MWVFRSNEAKWRGRLARGISMKLRYRRTGGIANVKIDVELDSAELPTNWRSIVHSPSSVNAPDAVQPDEFLHELFLEDGTRISCTDSHCTPELMVFFDRLYAQFLTQRRSDTKKK